MGERLKRGNTMQITDVTGILVNSGWRKNFLFVKVETDAGVSGWGEAYTQVDRERTVAVQVEELARYAVGRSPFDIKHFTQMVYNDFAGRRSSMELASAQSAIEIAMWDIVGRALDQPIYNLLGGPCREEIRVYANGWYTFLETAQEYADEAHRMVALGFDAIKFDPFPNPWRTFIPSAHEDHAVAVVEAVRQAVGPDVDLLLEFQRRLAPMHVIRLAERLEEFRPYWLEEPGPVDNLDAIAEVRAATHIPVVTGEALYSKAGFSPLLEKRCADIVNPDVCCVGGILELKEIATMAEPYLVAVSPHNFNSTTLGLAATVQASAVISNFIITEYFVPFEAIGKEICPDGLGLENGKIRLPKGPGLGIDLDEAALARHPYQAFEKRRLRQPRDEGS
ncbi:MAG: mandelate racemase/muconate lactonizing enzyme family protein [Rhodospirillales bacterium]|jgi:galactonate dehydratase|nr:mandelate racemase/muconate lactonizing enzyme family protein [Rhodospirillales bacterium]